MSTAPLQHIDEQRLEHDLAYRFGYVAGFMGFGHEDIDTIHALAPYLAPLIPTLVDTVYVKLFSYDVTKRIAAGMEYYGSYGPLTGFDPLHDQMQQFLPAIDVDLGPKWELNFGVGLGVTSSTDRLLIKGILGYRFNFHTDH